MSATATLPGTVRPSRISAIAVGSPLGRQVRQPVRPAARRPAPAAVPSGVRLTRRGRVTVVVGLVLLLLAAFSLGQVGATGSTSAQPETATVVVAPGQTLWGIARELAPGQDPRPVVDQIRRLNGLSSGELTVGQQLELPVRG